MVHRAGETTLKVMAEGVSKELTVKARQENGVLHVEITQRKPATD